MGHYNFVSSCSSHGIRNVTEIVSVFTKMSRSKINTLKYIYIYIYKIEKFKGARQFRFGFKQLYLIFVFWS